MATNRRFFTSSPKKNSFGNKFGTSHVEKWIKIFKVSENRRLIDCSFLPISISKTQRKIGWCIYCDEAFGVSKEVFVTLFIYLSLPLVI